MGWKWGDREKELNKLFASDLGELVIGTQECNIKREAFPHLSLLGSRPLTALAPEDFASVLFSSVQSLSHVPLFATP